MDAVRLKNQCERCEVADALVECQQCMSDGDEANVRYCTECSDLIHKGKLASHNVEPVKSVKMQQEKEALLEVYAKKTAMLQRRLQEIENVESNLMEQKGAYERALYNMVNTMQNRIKDRAKQLRIEGGEHIAGKQNELDSIKLSIAAKISELNNGQEEMRAKLHKEEEQSADKAADLPGEEVNLNAFLSEMPNTDFNFEVKGADIVHDEIEKLQFKVLENFCEENSSLGFSRPAIEEGACFDVSLCSRLSDTGTLTVNLFSDHPSCAALLTTMQLQIRDHFIHRADWATCAESGQVPATGEFVYAQALSDMQWYRAQILGTIASNYSVLLLDFGLALSVPTTHIILQDDIFSHVPYQTLQCSLFPEMQTSLARDVKWCFSDLLSKSASYKMTFNYKLPNTQIWYVRLDRIKNGDTLDVTEEIQARAGGTGADKPRIACRDIRLKDDPGLLERSKPKPRVLESAVSEVETEPTVDNSDSSKHTEEQKLNDVQTAEVTAAEDEAQTLPDPAVQAPTAATEQNLQPASTEDAKTSITPASISVSNWQEVNTGGSSNDQNEHSGSIQPFRITSTVKDDLQIMNGDHCAGAVVPSTQEAAELEGTSIEKAISTSDFEMVAKSISSEFSLVSICDDASPTRPAMEVRSDSAVNVQGDFEDDCVLIDKVKPTEE